MSTRLDRLFVLLENGGSGVTRGAAAKQLGEVVRLHPQELSPLLNRLHGLLLHKSWDVRIAAGMAVEAIVSNVPLWDPAPVPIPPGTMGEEGVQAAQPRLTLRAFSISRVLERGAFLMAADERVFNVQDDGKAVDSNERLTQQQQLVNQRLGLDLAAAVGVDVQGIVSRDDLRAIEQYQDDTLHGHGKNQHLSQDSVFNIVRKEMRSARMVLSSREINRARRKAKLIARQRSVDVSEKVDDDEIEPKRHCGEDRDLVRSSSLLSAPAAAGGGGGGGSDDEDRMVVDEGAMTPGTEEGEWPLDAFCDTLLGDLFSVSWETRHGVATALRHIISVQGRGAGKATNHNRQQMEESHQAWLEDVAVRLVCVLAMDRFGDFVSDQVVAPVRETCAQALGSIVHLMAEEGVLGVVGLLEEMLCRQEWETRHGGLLGLKYVLAVRGDLHTLLLNRSYPHIYRGLLDEMDDVVAVAASCLVPVAASLVEKLQPETIGCLLATLWDALLDIDDLTSSTSSVMMLLARLMVHPACRRIMTSDLSQLVPRLWPFLYHSSSAVRGSALRTLHTLTACPHATSTSSSTTSSTTTTTTTAGPKTSAPPPPLLPLYSVNISANTSFGQSQLTTTVTTTTTMTTSSSSSLQSASIVNERTRDERNDNLCVKIECKDEARDGEGKLKAEQENCDEKDEENEFTVKCKAVESVNEDNVKGDKIKKLSVIIKTDVKNENHNTNCYTSEGENGTPNTEKSPRKNGNGIEEECGKDGNDNDEQQSNVKDVMNCVGMRVECLWLPPIIQQLLTHIYQRSLLEESNENLHLVFQIWTQCLACVPLSEVLPAVCPLVAQWLCLSMANPKVSLDPSLLLLAHHSAKAGEGRKMRIGAEVSERVDVKYYLGGCDQHNKANEKQRVVVRARCAATRLLGSLSCIVSQPMPGIEYPPNQGPMECYTRLLEAHLASRSALQRFGAAAVVRTWAAMHPSHPCPSSLQAALHNCLTEVVYYDEIALSFTRLQQETQDFMAMLRHYKLSLDPALTASPVLTLNQIQILSGQMALKLFAVSRLRPKVLTTLEERRKAIQSSVSQTSSDQLTLAITTQAMIAGAVVLFNALPTKLNPIIKPLMDSIKKERNEQLQGMAAEDLTRLLEMCAVRPTGPNSKIIKNLANFLCVDPEHTPQAAQQEGNGAKESDNAHHYILSLTSQLKSSRQLGERSSSLMGRPPGRPPANAKKEDPQEVTEAILEVEQQQAAEVQRRGCTLALQNIASHFGLALSDKIPQLWHMMISPLHSATIITTTISSKPNDHATPQPSNVQCDSQPSQVQSSGSESRVVTSGKGAGPESTKSLPEYPDGKKGLVESGGTSGGGQSAQEAVNWLQLVEVVMPALHIILVDQFGEQAKMLEPWLYHCNAAVRHMAARVLGALAVARPVPTMTQLLQGVVPQLATIHSEVHRRGTIEAIFCVIKKLGFDVVPYSVMLVVPLLGSMSDPDTSVRLASTYCFATLIRLLPLEGGIPDPPSLSRRMVEQKRQEREFLERLLDPTKIANHVVPIPIHAELRSYQQSGVNWLAFLNQYKLHGILCDDMGLGKTLQSICILASDHHNKEKHRDELGRGDDRGKLPPIQSLVVCPPTLTGHWVYEVEKFVDRKHLNPLHYTGPPMERQRLRQFFSEHNLVVASYDIVRNDIDFFSLIKWNYVILDEGHVIKNSKTKSCRAIKQLTAQHRLILSGTPIQNTVLELWSLFDFLMPGFLGSERQFMARYSRPILLARDPKSSSKDQEAGVLAMEALHRQTLPFLLRRVKEEVLSDLPPKITQDYYCELSPLQKELYEDFANSQARHTINDTLQSSKGSSREKTVTSPLSSSSTAKPKNTHIFQALQYLKKVCNHPKLVLKPCHPEYERITTRLKGSRSSLSDISHSAKFLALKQLLLDCGIGTGSNNSSSDGAIVSQHRALVFCQLQGMLDIIERDLLKVHLPSVTYLRLDGSVPAGSRHTLVQRFNSDPSIDLLILTTQVGGLGLNLTGADTVIFVEHNWNPMRDLQAMDRAHRIGQKNVVNVYRLVTRGTLEEKIMGLQKFKLMTANTVISQENSSLMSMGTSQLLDLFSYDSGKSGSGYGSSQDFSTTSTQSSSTASHALGLGAVGAKAVLENLPDLWDQDQYESEYNLDAFMSSLMKSN